MQMNKINVVFIFSNLIHSSHRSFWNRIMIAESKSDAPLTEPEGKAKWMSLWWEKLSSVGRLKNVSGAREPLTAHLGDASRAHPHAHAPVPPESDSLIFRSMRLLSDPSMGERDCCLFDFSQRLFTGPLWETELEWGPDPEAHILTDRRWKHRRDFSFRNTVLLWQTLLMNTEYRVKNKKEGKYKYLTCSSAIYSTLFQ